MRTLPLALSISFATALACAPDRPRPSVDAEAPPAAQPGPQPPSGAAADAGRVVEPAPPAAAPHDEAVTRRPPPAPTAPPANANANGGAAAPSTTPEVPVAPTVFDRVLVKTRAPTEPEALRAAVERVTGARVHEARRSAMQYVVVTFEPTTPPRDAAAQKLLVDAIKTLPEVALAEGDRMMHAR